MPQPAGSPGGRSLTLGLCPARIGPFRPNVISHARTAGASRFRQHPPHTGKPQSPPQFLMPTPEDTASRLPVSGRAFGQSLCARPTCGGTRSPRFVSPRGEATSLLGGMRVDCGCVTSRMLVVRTSTGLPGCASALLFSSGRLPARQAPAPFHPGLPATGIRPFVWQPTASVAPSGNKKSAHGTSVRAEH